MTEYISPLLDIPAVQGSVLVCWKANLEDPSLDDYGDLVIGAGENPSRRIVYYPVPKLWYNKVKSEYEIQSGNPHQLLSAATAPRQQDNKYYTIFDERLSDIFSTKQYRKSTYVRFGAALSNHHQTNNTKSHIMFSDEEYTTLTALASFKKVVEYNGGTLTLKDLMENNFIDEEQTETFEQVLKMVSEHKSVLWKIVDIEKQLSDYNLRFFKEP